MELPALAGFASRAGLALRGAFHIDADDGVPPLADGRAAGTLVLLGWTGKTGWNAFAGAREATDGLPHPLDRWSGRVVDGLANEVGALPLYPFAGPPWLPFQRWAQRAEPVFPSPLGILIHPDWGLWHSYRGALAFAESLDLPERDRRTSPCDLCPDKPCLSTCPVGAFTPEGYDVDGCAGHVRSDAGTTCREEGCLARRACPVGQSHAYEPDQTSFLMRAFLAAR